MGYILVAYDDMDDLNNIRVFLNVSGYNVRCFSSWEEARSLFDGDHNCDLVITKFRIRDVTGADIVRYIRNSQSPHVPIMAINSTV